MQKTYKYKFMIPEHGEKDIDFDGTTFESKWGFSDESSRDEWNLKWIAEDAAEYAFSNNDGWEWSWPVTFQIYSMEDEHLGDVCVHIDYEPAFTSIILRDKDDKCY